MWDDPWALTLSARLILAATLLFALYTATRHFAEAYAPIRQVVVAGARHEETRAALAEILPKLRGGLLSMDLDAARQKFEGIPWVREARISRVWPARLRVDLEEHVAAAAWNGTALLNTHGEVFPVRPWAGLPDFQAPEGMEAEVAKRYAEFAGILGASAGIAALRVDARHAWRLELRPGAQGASLHVELGRERMVERLRRFVAFYPLVAAHAGPARRVDMRYPNGFAVEAAAPGEPKT